MFLEQTKANSDWGFKEKAREPINFPLKGQLITLTFLAECIQILF